VEVLFRGDIIARGVGLTKRAAEQAAAKEALEVLTRDDGNKIP